MRKLVMILLGFMMCIQSSLAMNISYNGSFQNCVDEKDIVINESELKLPGDHQEENLHLENVLQQDLHIKLVLVKNEGKVFDFSIQQDDKEIYKKNMMEIEEGTEIDLGTLKKGQSLDLEFGIQIPTSLNNDYTLSNHHASWKLVIEEETIQPNTGLYHNQVYLLVGISCIGLIIYSERRKKHEKA